jgi:6-phosphofructokinase 1
MDRIAVLTSGGDAPGMNANVRAVVRTATARGVEVIGIQRGYAGLMEAELTPLTSSGVGGIIGRGGTILGTARCEEFMHPEGRAVAARVIRDAGIEGLVVCGGDGSFHGAHALWQEHSIPVIGTPGTIDNDLAGTDFTIGFDTAVNTALAAIDRIRDTAESHRRIFIVEVMGRHAGFIALSVGIGGGADAILTPELEPDIPALVKVLHDRFERGKRFSLVVVAEGVELDGYPGGGSLKHILSDMGVDCRLSILGHQQRGGSPTALDREIGTLLGCAAVEELMRGGTDKMAGYVSGAVQFSNLDYTWKYQKPLDMEMYSLTHDMAI